MSVDEQRLPASDRALLLDYVASLKREQIQGLLREHAISPRSGTKAELRESIEKALLSGELHDSDLIALLDRIAPWGKQHVVLLRGAEAEADRWRSPEWVQTHIADAGLTERLNNPLPLALPEQLRLSSIRYQPQESVEIFAVERREHSERRPELDEVDREGSRRVVRRAYVEFVTRGLMVFRWNLRANSASLHISQLPSGYRYEDARQRFGDLVEGWFPISSFAEVELARAIAELHRLAKEGNPEARPQAFHYRLGSGREYAASSSSRVQSVLGEGPTIDSALDELRGGGVGHLGNFWWLPSAPVNSVVNPLQEEMRVVIVARENRVNITRPTIEENLRFVLSRIRELAQ